MFVNIVEQKLILTLLAILLIFTRYGVIALDFYPDMVYI